MITKKDKKLISKLIKGLPIIVSKTEKIKQTVSGRYLIENGIKTGFTPDANKTYLAEVPKPINHKTEAENKFKKGGIEAVYKYVELINKSFPKDK